MVLVASRSRQWCWWLAGVVICGTTSVVLVASRGRQLWYPASVVLVAGRHQLGCLLRSGPWSLKPAVVSGRSVHPGSTQNYINRVKTTIHYYSLVLNRERAMQTTAIKLDLERHRLLCVLRNCLLLSK